MLNGGFDQGAVEIGQKAINCGLRTDTPLVSFAAAVREPAASALQLLGLAGLAFGLRRPAP